MEVEKENTSNHLEESMAGETTTVINESLLQDTTNTDKESEKERTKSIPENREEEDASVFVTESEDSKAVALAEVDEKVEDERAEEVDIRFRNSESVAALSGGIENSVVVESVNVVEDSKDGGDGAVKEVDVPSDDVAAVECRGSELPCSVNVSGGDVEEAVVDRNGDLEMVEDTNVGGVSVIEKDENEGAEEILKDVKGDDAIDQLKNVQLEDVANVHEMVGYDVRNDGVDFEPENIVNVEEDETLIEEEIVAEVVKEEEIVAEAVNEEEIVAEADKEEEIVAEAVKEEEIVAEVVKEEEEAVAEVVKEGVDAEVIKEEEIVAEVVREDFQEEETMAENEEKIDGVSEHVEEETMMEDEEKSLYTEAETEKSLDTEMETEKSLDTEMETEKSLDTEMENEEEENLADEEKAQEEEEEEAEAEAEAEPEPSKKSSGAKRKRGGKAAPKKPIEEDVCFICFDGGDLVLCDRRNCPKAYHASCVNRDPAFFQSKGSWNCGWHLCSYCEKKAEYMCYTCTYSLCKACTKSQVILCVREKEKKGLCEPCMKTVMSIEKQEEQGNVNPDDKDSWEHLFKDYWVETKEKHNLSLDELVQAKNPSKGSGKQKSLISHSDDNSDNPPETLKSRKSKRNTKKQKYTNKEDEGSVPENADWVSNELLEFVMHMRNGDSSVISQFEVQDLLLEYIKRNKLRDPNRKSQIICDARLKNLFGKPRVAHIEMLKLLESHFLVKEEIDDVQGSVVDTEVSPLDKKRKGRKRGDKRGGPQSNREDYAAIDVHNINLIYLRRKLVEDLLDDMETFHDKIVATFVRIRVSGVNQKQDIYRLVQVKGTSEGARYTLSKRTTCTMLEILNLDKTETISIDSISNQDFMEDECKRLRQSIKFGFISRLTVGDVLDKAMELQAARVNDWLETEVTRLNHLRDRASDMGRKKELRECVEKLNLLKTPEERARRLEEIPLVHDDATMDPEYESDDDSGSDDKKQELYSRSDSYRFNKRGRDEFSPRGDYTSKESWSGGTSSSKNYEFSRNLSFNKNFSPKLETTSNPEIHHERKASFVQPQAQPKPQIIVEKANVVPESGPKVDEIEKMWHYKDPSEKIQGPFSMVQLRKWNKNGYFPGGLKIWRKTDKEDDGILLSDALEPNYEQSERNLKPKLKPSAESRVNLPSPKATSGWSAGSGNEGLQSPTPNSAHLGLVPCVNKDAGSVSVAVAPQTVDQAPQMVQGWGGAVNMNMAVPQQQQQQMAYSQWSGVPNMVQNPVGVENYMQMPQEQWGQGQFPFQPNMQQQQQPPNMSWAPTPTPTPNMGWVAPNTGGNWGPQPPMVQGNVDPAWAGWVQNWPMVAANGNSSWVGTQVAPPPNAGWGAPPASAWVGGAPLANNMGWVPPPPPAQAQQPPPPPQQPPPPAPLQSQGGNNNQNWNHGGSNQRRSRGGGSGFRGGGYNRGNYNNNNNQESYQKEGGE